MKGKGPELEEGELDSAEEAIKSAKKKKKIRAKNVYNPSPNFMNDDDDVIDDGEKFLKDIPVPFFHAKQFVELSNGNKDRQPGNETVHDRL